MRADSKTHFSPDMESFTISTDGLLKDNGNTTISTDWVRTPGLEEISTSETLKTDSGKFNRKGYCGLNLITNLGNLLQ